MTGRGRLRPMGRAAPAPSSPRLAELRRARRAPRIPPAALLGVTLARGGGAARLAAERRRVQQRRGRLRGPGGRDRDRPGAGRLLPRLPRAPAALPDRALARLSASPPRGLRALRGRPARRRDRLPGLRAGPAPVRAARGAAGGAADGADALPRGRHAPGPSGRADDVLRDADAGPVRPLPDQPAAAGGCTRRAPAWASPSSRRRRASCCSAACTRSWRSRRSSARGCATWPWRWG